MYNGPLAETLEALARWAVCAVQRASDWADRRCTVEQLFRWQWQIQWRAALIALPLFFAADHWHLWRLWVNGPLSDALVRDVVHEREIREKAPLAGTDGGAVRCFVPAHAGPAGLLPFLDPIETQQVLAWTTPTLSWLSGDWWVLDIANRRIVTMSRMDKAVLQPHPRMKEAKCVPANALKFINAGVNGQGQREFQVIDLSRSAAF